MLVRNSRYILAYSRGYLILRNAKNRLFIKKCRIHERYKSIWGIERVLRYVPRMAVDVSEDIFLISDHGFFYMYYVNDNIIRKVYKFSNGMNNPLNVCIKRNDLGEVSAIIFGEYTWNPEKKSVSIYKYDLVTCEKVYTFPAGTITHIHNIILDEVRKRYIILTGDEDKESAIWEANSDFTSVRMIVGGQQKFRACIAYPTSHGIYYATDTPLEKNWLYFLDDDKKVHEIYEMPGPVIYGIVKNNCLYMATTVEGNPKLGKWKYRFSNKLGEGVKDHFVHIIKCDVEGKAEEVARFAKDCLPMWLFQFGNVQFPITNDDKVYVSTQSTKKKGTFILATTGKKVKYE